MGDFLTKNRLVLAKAETTSGTDITPAAATDAVLVEEPRGTPNMELEQTDEVTGTLDSKQSIVGGGFFQRTHRVLAKGSGTAGTSPEFEPYLQASGLALTTLAAASTGTAQAGAAGSITLAAGAPASDLTGMVIVTTGGTGGSPAQERVITAYNTTTKVATIYPDWTVAPDATTTYSVSACSLYIPASNSLKTITDYLYDLNSAGGNARLRKLLGAAANCQFSIETRKIGRFNFDLRGMLSAPSGVANPTGQVFDSTRPRPLRDADAYLGGTSVCFRAFNLDFGNKIIQGDCPGQAFGYDPARIIDRKPTGRINPQLIVLSSRDVFSDMIAGTTKKLWLNWGETAGNRISLYLPTINYTGQEEDNLDGLLGEGIPFEAVGQDSWAYLSFY